MRQDRPLSPPLAAIERRLFGISDVLMESVERGETSTAISSAVRQSTEWAQRSAARHELNTEAEEDVPGIPTSMPDHLAELVARRFAARAAPFADERIPAQGQIVEVRQIKTPRPDQLDWIMQVPLYVLLDAPAETHELWHGWLAVGEADYAGWWDFVLQEEDMPFDPEAGVVQLWNPVRLYLPMAGRVAGRLSPARLQAVRALAAEYSTGDIAQDEGAWLGRVAARATTGGLQVVTGSPLGGDADPRHRFQHLYFHAAEAVREPARLALAASAEFRSARRSVGDFAAWLIDAAARGGQTLLPVPRIAVPMSRLHAGDDSDDLSPETVSLEFEAPDALRSADAAPNAEFAWGDEGSANDLVWDGVVRISIRELDSSGAGRLEVTAEGDDPVTCELRVAGILECRATVTGGGEPARIMWDGGESAVLTITAPDGRHLELKLAD